MNEIPPFSLHRQRQNLRWSSKKSFLLVTLAFLLTVCGPTHASNTHGLPSTDAELRAYFGDALTPYIVDASCKPAVPASGLTLAAFACQAYIYTTTDELLYVNQAAAAVGPLNQGNGTYWLAVHKDTTGTLTGWTRQGQTHYVWQLSATPPAAPSQGILLASITVTSSNITAVTPITKPLTNQCGDMEALWHVLLVHCHATSGSGTDSNPWVGWDTAIDWTQSNVVYTFVNGTYEWATPITVSGGHVAFVGQGPASTILRYTGHTLTALTFSAGNPNSFNEGHIGRFQITPKFSDAVKTAIAFYDIRQSWVHDIWVANWYGGAASIGMQWYGRDTTTYERLVVDAERPMLFSPPQWGFLGTALDSSTLRDIQLGQLVAPSAAAYPCLEVQDNATFARISFEGYHAYIKCKHGIYINNPNSPNTNGELIIQNVNWEQNTDPTGWMIYINGNNQKGHIQGLTIRNVYGGAAGNGIYLKGIQYGALLDNVWWIGWFGNGTGQPGVPLKVDAQAGLGTSTYTSGGTATGAANQTCTVINLNTCNSDAKGLLILTAANTLKPGQFIFPNNNPPPAVPSCTKPPTAGTLSNGSATCSGSIVLVGDTLGDGTFNGLTIVNSFMDGDKGANMGFPDAAHGQDPCDLSSGAAKGSHSCILGLRKVRSDNIALGDIGLNAVYAGNNAPSPLPNMTLMGSTLNFPQPGLLPVTIASASGALSAGQSVTPFLSLIDCPTGLDPCTGSFKSARLQVTIQSADQTIMDAADVYVNPLEWGNFPNVVRCLACSPNITANQIAGKFNVFHDSQPLASPNRGFFGFLNNLSVAVNWQAILWIVY